MATLTGLIPVTAGTFEAYHGGEWGGIPLGGGGGWERRAQDHTYIHMYIDITHNITPNIECHRGEGGGRIQNMAEASVRHLRVIGGSPQNFKFAQSRYKRLGLKVHSPL